MNVEHFPQSGKPDKKIYSITEKGLEALRTVAVDSKFKPRVLRHVSAVMLQLGSVAYFNDMIEKLTNQINDFNEKLQSDNVGELSRLVIARDMAVLNTDLSFATSALNLIAKHHQEHQEAA